MKKNQQGMTFFGVMFIGMALIFSAVLLMKLIPPYLEYMSVKKVIDTMGRDPALPNMTPQEVKASFDKRAVIDNITVIKGSDLDLAKENGNNVASASYTVTVPIVGNLSALIEFEASTKVAGK